MKTPPLPPFPLLETLQQPLLSRRWPSISRRGILALLSLLVTLATGQLDAKPATDNEDGSFFDGYEDGQGLFQTSDVQIAPSGQVSLSALKTSGSYTTVEIKPPSFKEWEQIVVDGSAAVAGDLQVEVLDLTGARLLGPLSVLGPITLKVAALNTPKVPGIRVRVSLTKSGAVAPTINSLRVSWKPETKLLIEHQGPATARAGDSIGYNARLSVNHVGARNLVLWQALPSQGTGEVISPKPRYPAQDDSLAFVSAGQGGVYTAIPATVGSIVVPANSIYWFQANLAAGTTALLDFAESVPNGTLDGTTVASTVHIHADNAAPADSKVVITTVHSTPAPSLEVKSEAGVFDIEGVLQTVPGTVNAFSIHAENRPGKARETLYNVAVYCPVSDLVPMIQDLGRAGSLDDFFAISAGGNYNPSYDPDGSGGPLPPMPVILWNLAQLAPGEGFRGEFAVRLQVTPPKHRYDLSACLTSDQSSPVCHGITVTLPLSQGTDGIPGLKFVKTASPEIAPYGGLITYTLYAKNKFPIKLNGLVIIDKIPENTAFRSAWFNGPELAASGAQLFYSTSTLFPDRDSPPPIDYTQAASGDLDAGTYAYWESYSANPPSNPSDVTWLLVYTPQLDSSLLPNQGSPALAGTPITNMSVLFDVEVLTPADGCVDGTAVNRAHIRAYELTDFSGQKKVNPAGTLSLTKEALVTTRGYKGTLSASSSLSPNSLPLPGLATYSLVLYNDASPTSDALANVETDLHLSQVNVNGKLEWPSVQGITPAGTYDGKGHIKIALGLMGKGETRRITVKLAFPIGARNKADYTLSMRSTGTDDLCGTSTVTSTTRGQLTSSPLLRVRADQAADLILSGGEYEHQLRYENIGTGPSIDSWLVERVAEGTVFVNAAGNPTIEGVWFSATDSLPPRELTPSIPLTGGTLAGFSPGRLDTKGTVSTADDVWTSPYGENTLWAAWKLPSELSINSSETVGLRLRNDHNGRLPGNAGSPQGTLLYNAAAILSSELQQAIGNQLITRIDNHPSIEVSKTGPSVVEAGVDFDWVVTYHNNTQLVPGDKVTVKDLIPPSITFLSATHTWNSQAAASGAPGGALPQTVLPVQSSPGNGVTQLTFKIAGPGGIRNGTLNPLEGGTITLRVRAFPGSPSGTTGENNVCATVIHGEETFTSCARHEVRILRPDLYAEKYASPNRVLSGDIVTYQLVAANRGRIAARDVELADTLPAGVSYISGSTTLATAGYSLAEPSITGQTLTWSLATGNALTFTGSLKLPVGDLPPLSGDILIQFKARVSRDVAPCSELANTVTLRTPSIEEGAYPNTASASVTVPPPELAVAFSALPLALPGQRVSSQITWVNQSPQAASDVYLIATLADLDTDPNSDLRFISITPPGAVKAYFHSGSLQATPAFDPLAPLDPANGWTAAPGSQMNRIALTLGALPGNSGPFSAELKFELIDPDGGSGFPVLPQAGTCFTNTVSIYQADPRCENTANNTAIAVVCTPALDMALKKIGSVQGGIPGITPGQTITYTFTYINSGTVNAYGVQVIDTPPASLLHGSPLDDFNFVLLTDSTGRRVYPVDLSGNPITDPIAVTREIKNGSIVWKLGGALTTDPHYHGAVGVPPGSEGSFQVFTKVAGSVADGTEVCNPGSVVALGQELLLSNNTNQSCVVVRRADAFVEKRGVSASGDPTFVERGEEITYTIEYNNLADITADNVRIHEIVPAHTQLISVSPPPGGTVSYTPDREHATSFTVTFDRLAGPANAVGITPTHTSSSPGGRPRLSIERTTGNNALITWPASANGYVLESADVITVPMLWQTVQSPVTQFVGGRQGITVAMNKMASFYQLRFEGGCQQGIVNLLPSTLTDGFLGWSRLYVNHTIPEGGAIRYTVGRVETGTYLFDLESRYTSVLVGPTGLDLSGIPSIYSNLVLRAEISASNSTNIPCVDGFQMTYHSTLSPSFTFKVRVDPEPCGKDALIPNEVTIVTSTPEKPVDNNSSRYEMRIRQTDLQVQCSTDASAILENEILTQTITWEVDGPEAAIGAYLIAHLPDVDGDGLADVTLQSVTPEPGVDVYYSSSPTSSPPAFDAMNPLGGTASLWTTESQGANHIAFVLNDRNPGSSGTLHYSTRVNAGTAGHTLCSTVAAYNARQDRDCHNNSCSSCTFVGTRANVYLNSIDPGCLHPGEEVTLQLTYGNNGNAPAVDVVLEDLLPPELTFVRAVPSQTGPGTWNNLGSTPGTLAPGETGTITLVARLSTDCSLVGQAPINVATLRTRSEEVSITDNRADTKLSCITPHYARLAGYVFEDGDGDCVREPGERGIPGVTVTLTGSIPCGTTVTFTTVTDKDGAYSFTGLEPGDYVLTETQPFGWTTTGDSLGKINGTLNGINLDPLDNVLGAIKLHGGDSGLEMNFCEKGPDRTPPSLHCPSDLVVECTQASGTPVEFLPTASSSAGGVVTVICSHLSGSAFPSGTTTVNCLAIDERGNTSACSFTVTVKDSTAPQISCAPDKTVECGSTWAFDPPTATDHCSLNPVTITVLTTVTNGLCPQVITRTWQVTDAGGNSNLCSQTVRTTDTTPPVFTHIPISTIDLGCNPKFIPERNPSIQATDTCGLINAPTHLLLGNFGSKAVVRHALPTGAFENTVTSGAELRTPNGMVFGPDGNLYVSSYDDAKVLRFSGATGVFIDTFASAGGLDHPSGLAFGPDGHLYVVSHGNSQVKRYHGTTGAFIDTFATASPDTYLFDLVFGPDGNLYVSSVGTSEVKRYDGTTGLFIDNFASGGGLSTPQGLTFGPDGHLYVVSFGDNSVKRFNGTTGAFIDTFTSGGSIRGGVGLGFGPHGNLYVISYYTSEVKRFDGTTGVFIDNVISGANTWFLTFSKPETVAQPPQVSCATVDTVQGCVHTRTLTYTAIDGCGNKATCSQVIRWTQDTTPPVITGLQDILVHSRAGTNGNRVSYPLPEVTDLCGGPVTLACNPPSGSFFRTGQTPVYCVATDACGNSITNSFTVTVRGVCVEIVEEGFTCTGLKGQNTYRFCFVNNSDRPLGHLTLVNLPDGVVVQPYFMDLTPPVEPGQTGCVSVAVSGLGIQTKLCFQIMAHTPDLEQCCIATHCVEVAFTPPQLTCPPNIEAITASGESKAVVDYTVKAGGQSGSPVTLVCTPPSGSPFPIGTTPVHCVATDACGRTKECSFQITVAAGRGDLWITDTPYYSSVAIDQGREPDPDMTLEQVYQSRGLWVHNDCVAPAGTHLSHQNPRYGQQNCVFAEIKNRGNLPVAGAHVEFYWANAGLGLTWPISWTFMGTASLPTLNPGDTYIATAPWYPAGTGHYCLLARIVSIVDPMTYAETPSIWTNVRYNNNLGWRNVNVTDCLRTPGDKVEVRVRNFEPAPKKLTLVFTADQDFLPNGGTAILSPGTTLFQRWMAAGGKGTHVEVINGNEIRFTGSPAVLEDIPFAQNEERIFNLTLRADQPMPVRGSSHTYHAHLQQKLDGETVGGVSYAVITRTYETDTDLDGLADIEDDDDDNDGIPDEIDDNPMGETECPPSVLTLSRVAGESTLTWNGLGYRLQSSAGLGQAWVDMPGASSPYVLQTDGGERLFRLICR